MFISPPRRIASNQFATTILSKIVHLSLFKKNFLVANWPVAKRPGGEVTSSRVVILVLCYCPQSSLLMVLLGELPVISGKRKVHGKIGYASQQAWIFSGTVKENIVFGQEFVQDRYLRVIEACALKKVRNCVLFLAFSSLNILKARDLTVLLIFCPLAWINSRTLTPVSFSHCWETVSSFSFFFCFFVFFFGCKRKSFSLTPLYIAHSGIVDSAW